jgi:hypothetical protein
MGTGDIYKEVNRPEREVHSPPSSAEVNKWSYTSTPHPRAHGLNTKNFTFLRHSKQTQSSLRKPYLWCCLRKYRGLSINDATHRCLELYSDSGVHTAHVQHMVHTRHQRRYHRLLNISLTVAPRLVSRLRKNWCQVSAKGDSLLHVGVCHKALPARCFFRGSKRWQSEGARLKL